MNYLIVIGILIGSCLGTYLFLRKKIAFVLSEVEERRGFGLKEIAMPFVEQCKQSQLFQRYTPEKVLHKTLSRTRVLALKTENKVAFWLEKLRMRAQEKNGVSQEEKKLPGDYWERLRGKKK